MFLVRKFKNTIYFYFPTYQYLGFLIQHCKTPSQINKNFFLSGIAFFIIRKKTGNIGNLKYSFVIGLDFEIDQFYVNRALQISNSC